VTLIRPFIPAKDFALSRAFYEAIGFVEKYSDDKLAILDQDGAGILLQDYYVKEWAENCMAQLFVPDLDGW
jgi:predicted lactoylglutathione lyase